MRNCADPDASCIGKIKRYGTVQTTLLRLPYFCENICDIFTKLDKASPLVENNS